MTRQPRWSCKFSPTPGRSWTGSTPCSRSKAAAPTPDTCSRCGELIEPPESSTSPRARMRRVAPCWTYSMPTARLPSNRMRRAQIGEGGRAAPQFAHRELVFADALLLGTVEVGIGLKPGLERGSDEGVVQFVLGLEVGDRERPVAAVELVGAALLALGAAEIGQHVVVRPAGIAHLSPQDEILALAADIDQPV